MIPTKNRFQGEPAMIVTPDGMTIKFVGGQPITDQGVENAFTISLGTEPGYWGNVLRRKESEKIGSRMIGRKNMPITPSSLADDLDAVQKDLEWAVKNKLIKQPEISVTNPNGSQRKVVIKYETPAGTEASFQLNEHQGKWKAQALHPAHEEY
jgi:phage gp46-like protein